MVKKNYKYEVHIFSSIEAIEAGDYRLDNALIKLSI